MTALRRAQTCFTCGRDLDDGDRLVLARGKRQDEHCSESCLQAAVRQRQIARAAVKSRWLLRLLASALLLAGASFLWQLVRAPLARFAHAPFWKIVNPPQPQSISFDPPESRPEEAAAPAGPIMFGPPWPPSDQDWLEVFHQVSWVYPLPGPVRRTPTIDSQLLIAESAHPHATLCRTEGRCGADLGGELWGEYVYAAQDGTVDRVQHAGDEQRGGQSVRLAHFGGLVFTQYFHLAAIPRALVAGGKVKAGDLVGLVGDTGAGHPQRRLGFSLSIWPSRDRPEVFWDPTTLMTRWPLRAPNHGTVAGLAPSERDGPPGHPHPPPHPRQGPR
jgi:Peptidase family M23